MVQVEIWTILVDDGGGTQTRSTEVSVYQQQRNTLVEPTPCRNRDCDESGGISFISSVTEAIGGASSSGREVLSHVRSFARSKPEQD
jgi:hypothetical protein